MAGDVKVAVVSKAHDRTSGNSTDYTKTDFGTPKACIVIQGLDFADDTPVAIESRISIGFSDFSSHFCISHQDEDNQDKVDCDALKSNTQCYQLMSVGG